MAEGRLQSKIENVDIKGQKMSKLLTFVPFESKKNNMYPNDDFLSTGDEGWKPEMNGMV